MNEIKVKVTLSGITEKTEFSISFIEDYTKYAEELILCKNIFDDTKERMTETNIERYFSPGLFTDKDIEKTNGVHFLYGFIERLAQSDNCPDILRTYEGDLNILVEKI